jgi:hypothetical protein
MDFRRGRCATLPTWCTNYLTITQAKKALTWTYLTALFSAVQSALRLFESIRTPGFD